MQRSCHFFSPQRLSRLRPSIAAVVAFLCAGSVLAQNGTTVGTLRLNATYECIGLYANFTGDADGDNAATLQWRESGGTWKTGMALTVDRRVKVPIPVGGSVTLEDNPYVNQFRGSIFGLTKNTTYEVKVTFTDSDGVTGGPSATTTITTRSDAYPSASGAVYASPSGDDTTGDGSLGNPYLTLSKAATQVTVTKPNVILRAGTYAGNVSFHKTGSASNFYTIQAYQAAGQPAETVTISTTGTVNGIDVTYGHYIRFKGLTFQGDNHGIDIYRSSNIVIENCTFNQKQSGIQIVHTTDCTVQNNTLLRTQDPGVNKNPGLILVKSSLLDGAVGRHVIRNNSFVDSTGIPRSDVSGNKDKWDGIQSNPDFEITGGMGEDSDVYGNYFEGFNDEAVQVDTGGINTRVYDNTFNGGENGRNCISMSPTIIGPTFIVRNKVYGGWNSFIKVGWASTGARYVYHNAMYSPSPFIGTNPSGIKSDGNDGIYNTVSRNNIFHIYDEAFDMDSSPTDSSADYDCLYHHTGSSLAYWSTSYSTFAAFQAIQEANGMYSSAVTECVDPGNGNFMLKSSSQLKDAGVAIAGINDSTAPTAWRTVGSAPDIGAVEAQAATTTEINNNDAAIAYSGTWSSSSQAGRNYFNNDHHWSKSTGAFAQFTFTGTSIQWVSSKQDNYGQADVYLDGVFQATVDLYAASPGENAQTVFAKSRLTSGSHTIKIVVKGQKQSASSDYYIDLDSLIYSPAANEVNDNVTASITYAGGTWSASAQSGRNYCNGDHHYSKATGAYAEYVFTGTSIQWISSKQVNYGYADVYLDGVLQATVNLYAASPGESAQTVFAKSRLSSGSHTIKVVVKGQKQTGATDHYVDLDSFIATQ